MPEQAVRLTVLFVALFTGVGLFVVNSILMSLKFPVGWECFSTKNTSETLSGMRCLMYNSTGTGTECHCAVSTGVNFCDPLQDSRKVLFTDPNCGVSWSSAPISTRRTCCQDWGTELKMLGFLMEASGWLFSDLGHTYLIMWGDAKMAEQKHPQFVLLCPTNCIVWLWMCIHPYHWGFLSALLSWKTLST